MGFQRCAYVCAFLRGLGGAEEQENMPPNTVYGMRMRHGAIRLWKNAQGYLARCVGRKGGIPSFESVKEVQNKKTKNTGTPTSERTSCLNGMAATCSHSCLIASSIRCRCEIWRVRCWPAMIHSCFAFLARLLFLFFF